MNLCRSLQICVLNGIYGSRCFKITISGINEGDIIHYSGFDPLFLKTCNFKLISCLVIFFVTGCLAEPVVNRPDRDIAASQSAKFLKNIGSLAEEGDWIVTRGYHAGDVLVANATGMPISHTGIYDRELRQVIEADAGGVGEYKKRITPYSLARFI